MSSSQTRNYLMESKKIGLKPSDSSQNLQGWSNHFQNLESDLEEKIEKEKQMCSQINDLKEDLEKKLKEIDENTSNFLQTTNQTTIRTRPLTSFDTIQKLGAARPLRQKLQVNKLVNETPSETYSHAVRSTTYGLGSPSKSSSQLYPTAYTELKTSMSPKALTRRTQAEPVRDSNLSQKSQSRENSINKINDQLPSQQQTVIQLELERQIKNLQSTNESLKNDIDRLKQTYRIDNERIKDLTKENYRLTDALKEAEEKSMKFTELIKDLEWENEKLLDEVSLKENRMRTIKDNDYKVREYQDKYDHKVLELEAMQRQIDAINEKHLQFKQQMLSRDEDIKSEIKTSELIISQQEAEINNLNEIIDQNKYEYQSLLREQQTHINIEEDWKNEVSQRIQLEKQIEDIALETTKLQENHQIKEVQMQAKMLMLFAENERLHQIIMNTQLEIKTLKGQVAQYQQNTLNLSFNLAAKPVGSGSASEELDKIKLHLQIKLAENETLRNKVASLEKCPSIITELERKLTLQISENKRLNSMMFGRINEW